MDGSIVHGVCECYFVAEPDLVKNGSTTLEYVGRSIDHAKNCLQDRNSPIPQHLVLQLDNTCRENKNNTMILGLALQVARGHFCSIMVNFMEVSHTHNDQDQRFAVARLHLRSAPCLQDPKAFVEALQNKMVGCQGRSVFVELSEDYRDWNEYVHAIGQLHNHTGPLSTRSFRLVKRGDLLNGAPDDLQIYSGAWDKMWTHIDRALTNPGQ